MVPVYTQIYGKYRGFGVRLGLLGGVVPLCLLYHFCAVFCVVRASFSIHAFSHLPFFALSSSSSLVARFAGGDLHYHGAGLSAGRGNDIYRGGIVDVERFANGILVYCDCNLDIVAAWHKLANQNPAFLVAVGLLAGPIEINHDVPHDHFGIKHAHPYVFGGKSEASRGIIGLAGSQKRLLSVIKVFVEGILLDIIRHSARSRRDGLNTWVN